MAPIDAPPTYPYGRDVTLVQRGIIRDSVFLQRSKIDTRTHLFATQGTFTDPEDAATNSTSIHNAFLSKYWDLDSDHWMRIEALFSRNYYAGLANSYWGTASSQVIEAVIHDHADDFNLGGVVYQPWLSSTASSTYPFVSDVMLLESGLTASALYGPTPLISSGTVECIVTFNRDMDTDVQPAISFGPADP